MHIDEITVVIMAWQIIKDVSFEPIKSTAYPFFERIRDGINRVRSFNSVCIQNDVGQPSRLIIINY